MSGEYILEIKPVHGTAPMAVKLLFTNTQQNWDWVMKRGVCRSTVRDNKFSREDEVFSGRTLVRCGRPNFNMEAVHALSSSNGVNHRAFFVFESLERAHTL